MESMRGDGASAMTPRNLWKHVVMKLFQSYMDRTTRFVDGLEPFLSLAFMLYEYITFKGSTLSLMLCVFIYYYGRLTSCHLWLILSLSLLMGRCCRQKLQMNSSLSFAAFLSSSSESTKISEIALSFREAISSDVQLKNWVDQELENEKSPCTVQDKLHTSPTKSTTAILDIGRRFYESEKKRQKSV